MLLTLAELLREWINPSLFLMNQPWLADEPLHQQPVIDFVLQKLGRQLRLNQSDRFQFTIAYFREFLDW